MNLNAIQKLLKDDHILVYAIIENNKASEAYVKTRYIQEDGFAWDTYVPFVDRRAGLDLQTENEVADYVRSLKPYFKKDAMEQWRKMN